MAVAAELQTEGCGYEDLAGPPAPWNMHHHYVHPPPVVMGGTSTFVLGAYYLWTYVMPCVASDNLEPSRDSSVPFCGACM